MADDLYISESAWTEYQRQDVFGTMAEFMAAMPPGTKAVHLLPEEIATQVEGFRPVIAGDENVFTSPLTQMYTHKVKKEDPPAEEESIWRVDNANDIAKDQGMRDETEIGQMNYQDPYDFGLLHRSAPMDSDEYDRDLDGRAARLQADYSPSIQSIDKLYVLATRGQNGGSRTALNWDGIVQDLKPSIMNTSKDCTVRLKRANPDQGRWSFTVQSKGSKDTHTVHLKAVRPKGSTAKYVPKLDIKIGCSCNFWKWQGPDYHAAKHGYLDRKPASNGAAPIVRDPHNQNRVCKHVYASSGLFLKYVLQPTKKGSMESTQKNQMYDFYNHQASANYMVVKQDGASRRLKAVALQLESLGVNETLVSDIFTVAESFTHTG